MASEHSMAPSPRLLAQYARFAVLAGIGWMLALVLLWLGVHALYLPVWVANAIGDAVAITFVFFASPQAVFGTHNPHKARTFRLWVLWQLAHIALISWAVDALTGATEAALRPDLGRWLEITLKVAITPVTLTLNFMVSL